MVLDLKSKPVIAVACGWALSHHRSPFSLQHEKDRCTLGKLLSYQRSHGRMPGGGDKRSLRAHGYGRQLPLDYETCKTAVALAKAPIRATSRVKPIPCLPFGACFSRGVFPEEAMRGCLSFLVRAAPFEEDPRSVGWAEAISYSRTLSSLSGLQQRCRVLRRLQ